MGQRKVSCEAYTDRGIVGKTGKSAYKQAVEGGYQGTEEEFEQALASDIATVASNISDINSVGQSITEVKSVADNLTDVSTVSANISNVNTVAGISSDVTQVSSISNAVQTVSSHDSEVVLVADNMAGVMTTASNIMDVSTVAGISIDVSTVANNNSNVTAVAGNAANINTVANNISNVNTVASNISDINTVATNISDVLDVSDNLTTIQEVSENMDDVIAAADAAEEVLPHITEINNVSDNIASVITTASNISNVNVVAGISSDVSTVAGIAVDISAVEDIKTDVSAVAANVANINAVAGNETNINAVNSNKTNIDAVAGNSTNINAVAGNESNINAVNANKTNIDAVAGNNTDIATVATNISNVNTAATNMAAIIAAPTAAQNAATSATNAQTWAEGTDTAVATLGGEHSSKGWANVAKQYAESIGAALKYKGSVATYSALPSIGQEVGDMWNVLDTGKNYAWTGAEWDDLSGVVDLSAYRTAANQDIIDGNLSTAITNHTGDTSNPHSVTASQVGLGNVDNTSDLNKPISTATQTALDGKQATISSTNMLSSDLVDDANHTNKFVTASDKTTWNGKQDALVSGTNIKTVNGNSLLGSGNVDINGLPTQTGQGGKFLTTDGTDASWSDKPITNTATATDSLTILGTANTSLIKSVNIGSSSVAGRESVSVGYGSGNSTGYGSYGVAIGENATYGKQFGNEVAIGRNAKTSAQNAIQIGCYNGASTTNSDANTFKVANANGNFEIMSADGTIPQARLAPGGTNGQVLMTDGTNASWADIAALNDKVDLSSSWGFPSSTYVDLTLPASGNTYTVPADGYLYLAKKTNGNGQYVGINGPYLSTQCVAYGSPMVPRCYLAVKKGDVCTIEYSAGDSSYTFRFVYAQKTN